MRMTYSLSPRVGVIRIDTLAQTRHQIHRLFRPITPEQLLDEPDSVLIQFAQGLTALLPRTGQSEWEVKGLRVRFSPSLFGQGYFDISVNGVSLHRLMTPPALYHDSRPAQRAETIVALLHAFRHARTLRDLPWWGRVWLWFVTRPLAWLDGMDEIWEQVDAKWHYPLQNLTLLLVLLRQAGIEQVTLFARPHQKWMVKPLADGLEMTVRVTQYVSSVPREGAFVALALKGRSWWERNGQHDLCFEIPL